MEMRNPNDRLPKPRSCGFSRCELESIKRDFYEAFRVIYGNASIELRFMDEESTVFDPVFGDKEYSEKYYKQPLKIPAMPDLKPELPDNLPHDQLYTAVFSVPVLALTDNEYLTPEEENIFKRATVVFAGRKYDIVKLLPDPYLDGTFLFYDFQCNEVPTGK